MAKVQSSKSGRIAAISGASGIIGGTITAVRGDEERTFRKTTWDNLPPNKEGWEEKTEKPADIPKKSTTASTTTDPVIKTIAPAKVLPTLADLEKVDVTKLTPAEKRKHTMALNAAKKAVVPEVPEGMVALTVDQEYLDLHPEEAAKGLKVGQIIHVAKAE